MINNSYKNLILNSSSTTVAKKLTASTTTQSVRLIATIQTLGYLAKIRPQYLVKHVMLLQPYLATNTKNIVSFVSSVIKYIKQ